MFWIFIIGLCIGAGLIGWLLGPKLKTKYVINQQIQKENLELEQQNNKLKQENRELNIENTNLISQRDNITNEINRLKAIAKITAEEYLSTEMELAEERFDRAMENLSSKYQNYEEECKQTYLEIMEDCCNEVNENINSQKKELDIITKLLLEQTLKAHSLIEASKREEEEKNKESYYGVVISQEDKEEVAKLREVGKYLRHQDMLNKIIWKGYYEKPTSLMCGRVVGPTIRTGIYKITNRINNMAYIGQAVDIGARFKQHIKRGLGAETPTRNKLYPAMFATGIENFKFEILADCPPNKLNEMEKYFIEVYETQSFGYNVTQGNK